MDRLQILATVVGMGLVTLACRVIPFVVLKNLSLPPRCVAWMRYLPIAILGGVVAPQLLFIEQRLSFNNLSLIAAGPTVLAGLLTRNVLVAVVVGVASLALLRAI